jgi:hypothetical protein
VRLIAYWPWSHGFAADDLLLRTGVPAGRTASREILHVPRKRKAKLVLGKDYVVDASGRCVFTREYLLTLGECCHNGCAACPFECAASEPRNANQPAPRALRRPQART